MINLLRTKIKSIQTNLKDFAGGKPFNKEKKLKEFGFMLDGPSDLIINEDSVSVSNPSCPYCKSHNLSKDGKNPKKIPGTNKSVKKQRFKCNDCGKKFTIMFGHTKKGDHHFTAIKAFAAFIRCASSKTSVSLRDVRDLIKFFFDYPFSYESVRTSISKLIPKIRKFLSKITGSGYYSYDEQWVKIKGKWKYRQTIVDYKQGLILNERVVETVDEDTVFEFFVQTFIGSPMEAITTDGHKAYSEAIEKLEKIAGCAIKHQRCTFHKQIELTKIIHKFKKSVREKYKKLKSQIRLIFSLNDPDVMEECFQELGGELKLTVKNLLEKNKPEVVARKLFDSIYILRNNYPKEIAKYIESINDIWEKLTHFYSDPNISKTSNPNESEYSYSSGTKRRFKTTWGIEEHFLCRAFFKNNFKDGLTLGQAATNDSLLSMF